MKFVGARMLTRFFVLGFAAVTLISASAARQTSAEISTLWQLETIEGDPVREFVLQNLLVLPDGDLVVAGFGETNDGSVAESERAQLLVVHRIAPDGTERWRATMEIAREPYERIVAILAPDGGLFLCDGMDSVFRLNLTGSVDWQTRKRSLRLRGGCQDLAYHPSGLLLLSGVGGNSDPAFEHAGFQPTLFAYDAATGEFRWRAQHLSLDMGIDPIDTAILVDGDAIDWWGRATAGIDRSYLTSFSFSFRVGSDGTILDQTAAARFLDCWSSFGATVTVDGRIFAEFCDGKRNAIDYQPTGFIYWLDWNWARPHRIYATPADWFDRDESYTVDRAIPVGSTPGSVTFLFPAIPIMRGSSFANERHTLWLDLMMIEPDRVSWKNDERTTMSIGIPIDNDPDWRLEDVVAPGGRFRIAPGETFYMLIGESDLSGRLVYRIDQVVIGLH